MKHLNKLYPRSLYHPIFEEIYINTRIKDHEFKMNLIDYSWYQADFDDDNMLLWKIDENKKRYLKVYYMLL